jgi:hypothetical protein
MRNIKCTNSAPKNKCITHTNKYKMTSKRSLNNWRQTLLSKSATTWKGNRTESLNNKTSIWLHSKEIELSQTWQSMWPNASILSVSRSSRSLYCMDFQEALSWRIVFLLFATRKFQDLATKIHNATTPAS